MEKTSLEALLRERLENPRAMIAALSVDGDTLALTFGDIGELPRIVLNIDGNRITRVTLTAPDEPEATEKSAADAKGAISSSAAPVGAAKSKTQAAAKSDEG